MESAKLLLLKHNFEALFQFDFTLYFCSVTFGGKYFTFTHYIAHAAFSNQSIL